ncbi:MAG TPA: Hint domain-containing protein, partial [Acidocella sp.]|nr:Hint domain-containing protein [Acidocella sp.]
INGPQAFSGTIDGFLPGDQLIFPGLSNFSVLNEGQGSFTVSGLDSSGTTDSYTIFASIPAGTALVAGLDAQGDPNVTLRPAAATITQTVGFIASAGVAQPLQGLSLQLPTGTTQSLSLIISAAQGSLSDGTLSPAASIVLSAAGITALNAALAGLTYTGTGVADTLTFASSSGVLSGLLDYTGISAATPGTVNGYASGPFSEAQIVSFGVSSGLPVISTPAAPGEILVAGTVEFADALAVNGISGTALLVDAGATAIFNAAAAVALGGDMTLGDASGAGTLAIITTGFSSSGNMTLAGAGSVADVLGALTLAGTLGVGQAGAAVVNLGGSLDAGAVSSGSGGTLFAYGDAAAKLGDVNNAGSVILDGAARVQAAAFYDSGALALGGTASLAVGGLLELGSPAGSIQIGADASLSAAAITLSGGAMSIAGTLASAGTILAGADMTLSGGTIDAQGLGVASGTLAGFGVVNVASIVNNGDIVAQGGTLILNGSITNASMIEVAASAALDIAGNLGSGAPVMFAGADALITLNDPSRPFTGVQNMVGHDAIDLVGVAPSLVSYSGGATAGYLTIYDTLGSVVSTFGIGLASGQPAVSIVSDGAGGSLITLGDELPCFARGTRLLTPNGYRAVESLKPGDPLVTATGDKRPVRWIGRRTLDLGPGTARFALPVLIMPGAFGPGLPLRPLRLSPLHCVYADGVLIPATHLVNGATIIREQNIAAMTYYHIELDRHDILLAEALPCESYFDAGNRGALYHELGRRSPARRAYAPTVTKGARLAAMRRRLHGIALAAGFSLTYWPILRAVGAGQSVTPVIRTMGRWRMARFVFVDKVRDVTLLSSVACPADTDPESEDRRELGVCLRPNPGMRLGQGFYANDSQDEGVWMGRVATLRLDRPEQEVTLPLAAIVQSWVRPTVDAKSGTA